MEQPMSDESKANAIGAFGLGLIGRKARQLVRRPDFSRDDPRDLEQELATRLLKRLQKYDPQRSERDHFISMAVKRLVANLIRDRRARRPRDRSVLSLDAGGGAADGNAAPRAAAVTQKHLEARTGTSRRTPEELAKLALDVATVLAGLPREDRDLVAALLTKSKAEVARERGVPRSTLEGDVQRLRRRFERGNLQDYL
jgi:RNA polymerase sigma-70 factor (ECF subfamily)